MANQWQSSIRGVLLFGSNGRNPPVAKTLRPVAKKNAPFATGLRPGCDRCDHQIARLNICPRDILHPPKRGGRGIKGG